MFVLAFHDDTSYFVIPGFIKGIHGSFRWCEIRCKISSNYGCWQRSRRDKLHPCKAHISLHFHLIETSTSMIITCVNLYFVEMILQVLEFQKGRLENLFWKKDGCSKCSGNAKFVCLNKEECAIKRQSCKNQGGQVDCSLGIQLAFSGTDKHYTALNSWYEVANLKQYSLYGLYSNLKGSLSSQFNNLFWWVSFSSCVLLLL